MFDMFDNAEHTFVDIAKRYDNYNDIKDRIRILHSYGEISDIEYDYILINWDSILKRYDL